MRFLSVQTVGEAVEVLAELGEDARPLAGGTDVMIQMRRGELTPEVLLHLEPISELRQITSVGSLQIGALASHDRIARSEHLRTFAPSVAQAAATVGGWQTQTVGTIGGNVVNASPAADLVPPLLVHDATVVLQSSGQQREVALSEFLVGRRSTTRRPNELLTEIRLGSHGERTGDSYFKVGRRGAMEVAIVGIAVRLTLATDFETVEDARVAVCSCGPLPYRARECEQLLVGQAITPDVLAEAGRALVRSAQPIDDVRSTAAYRARLLPRVLAEAARRAAESIGTEREGSS